MSRKQQFLVAVIGEEGALALQKATDYSPDLRGAIVARSIMGWLQVATRQDYVGNIPGNPIAIEFRKNEDTYTGTVALEQGAYVFENAGLHHLAGSVAVALGLDNEVPGKVDAQKLASLGKSIDLLIKARLASQLQKAVHGQGGDAHKIGLAGPAAKPQAAIAPVAPVATQAPNAKPKLPRKSKNKVAKSSWVKIKKSQLSSLCSVCSDPLFEANTFKGCQCFQELRKGVLVSPDGSYLRFDASFDEDAIAAIVASLKE